MKTTFDELSEKVMAIFEDHDLDFVHRGSASVEFQFAVDATRHIEDSPCQDDSNTMEFITDDRYWRSGRR
jgi:hypothetical protein